MVVFAGKYLAHEHDFCVQVRAEEKHIVHNPDEQQHHNHTTNEAVGGVVLAEVVGVEGEAETAQAHAEEGECRTGGELPLFEAAHVRGCGVQQGDEPDCHEQDEDPAAVEPDELDELHIDGFGYVLTDHVQDGYAQQHHEHHEYHEDDEHGGDEHVDGFEYPAGAAFTHVVDRVESSAEGSGVPGGGPERTEDTGQQHQACAMVAGNLLDGVFHNGVHLGGRVVFEEGEDDGGAFLTVTEYAQ